MQPDAPAPDEDLVRRISDALRAEAPTGWTSLTAEWSQAGTQHSGRMIVSDPDGRHRAHLPDAAVTAFAALRVQMAAPGLGTWLSARVDVTPDAPPVLSTNPDRRPNWDSTTDSMLDEPVPDTHGVLHPAIPTEDRWLVDLRRFPRDRAHVPVWLAPDAVEGDAVAELRAALDGLGVPRAAVVLPGETEGPTFEGTLEVVRYSGSHFGLQVRDYGLRHLMGEFRSERQACLALWEYLTAPLPPAARISQAEMTARTNGAQRSYADLHARLRNVGKGGLLTNLAPGVVYDRFGGLDGLYFFGAGTPWEQRSLPPTANAPGAALVPLVALRPVEIQAEIVDPWFGQPGGGIRFHVEGGRAVRDLVREQVLALVDVVG